MKVLNIAAVSVLATGSLAVASPIGNLLDSSMYTISAQPIDGGGTIGTGSSGTAWYDGITGDYAAFAPAVGAIGFDDYGTAASADIVLTEFKFVGGVDTVGGVVFFDFFDDDLNFVDGFGVTLSQAGNFIWTITLQSEVIINASGALQMTVDDGTAGGPMGVLGQFFLTPNAPVIGTNDIEFGGAPGSHYHAFAITGNLVPAPGALALLGLAGLVGTRRRRA